MKTDRELLRQYAELRDEAAFAEIVRRETDFVYSIALRVTLNGALAQDATQTVFAQLAQQAAALGHYDTLLGWLHTTARNRAINLVRGEERRRAREHEAASMPDHAATPEVNWAEIAPLLDEAVGSLPESDRQAVLLRFFQGWSHQQVGVTLGLSEDAARKRIERALEKLRGFFARRGVTATSVLLAATITENSVQAAPAGLAESATQASLRGATAITTESLFLKILLMSTKNKILVAGAILLMVAAWWILHLNSPPETVAAATTKGAVVAPAMVVAAAPVVAAPIAPPAPKLGVASDAGTQPLAALPLDPNAESKAELNAALAKIAHLFRTGDVVGAYLALCPPADVDPDWIQQLQKQDREDAALVAQDPGFERDVLQSTAPSAQLFESLEDQTPTFNAAGDEATYTYRDEISNYNPQPMTFVKINGEWYRK